MKAHSPAPYDKDILMAVRALAAGTANEGQQRVAFEWIVIHAARVHDMSYQEADAQATAFMEGRRFVGNQVLKMLRPETLKALEAPAPRTKRGNRGSEAQ